jgi:hypothetical protein
LLRLGLGQQQFATFFGRIFSVIDLHAMNRDPWPTWPVKKEDIRNLANALRTVEADNRQLVVYLKQATDKIADLKEQLAAAQRPLVVRPLWRP